MLPWSRERKELLIALWPQKMTCEAIGVQLGVSKNAVCGMARRLGLPARPNPTRPGRPKKPRPESRWHRSRLQSLAIGVGRRFCDVGPPPKHCQFIAGEPSADDRCKCRSPAREGSSYCDFHHALCWMTAPKLKVAA